MSTVTVTDVSHRYPATSTPAIEDVSFHVSDGEFFVILGPPGSGKSTMLRMIHGMERPSAGTIALGQRDVTRVPPGDRDVTLAFENYALYPHMDVAENMAFALRLSGISEDEIDRRVSEAASRLDLREVLRAKPEEIDGPQRQKVALARALVRNPQVFVMDEPLANLPAEERTATRDQIRRLQRDLGITTLYATTSAADAAAVGDRIALFDAGRLTGIYPPDELPRP